MPIMPARALVLLAEDDSRAARVLARMLSEDGFDVETVVDGARAIERLAQNPVPDVLLADYRLPGADGVAVAKYARTQHPKMRVLMLTSYPEVVLQLFHGDANAPQIVPKPIAYDELTRRLRVG
jgi:DNA-binding response OmpR family regulator